MELACANEQCSYLVHRTEPFGGFCCKRCHQCWSSGRPARHGFLCEERTAERQAARAEPNAPSDPLPVSRRRGGGKRKGLPVPLQEPFTRLLQHAPSAASGSRPSTASAPRHRRLRDQHLLTCRQWRRLRSRCNEKLQHRNRDLRRHLGLGLRLFGTAVGQTT